MTKEEIQQFIDKSSKSGNVAVINLDTGKLNSFDRYRCIELGMPEGYKAIKDMEIVDWIFIIETILERE